MKQVAVWVFPQDGPEWIKVGLSVAESAQRDMAALDRRTWQNFLVGLDRFVRRAAD